MEYTKEQMLEEAKKRGYSIHASNSAHTWYSFMHDRYSINLELFVETGEFKLTHFHGLLTTSTGKCGSFMNEEHFLKFQRWMIYTILKLDGVR